MFSSNFNHEYRSNVEEKINAMINFISIGNWQLTEDKYNAMTTDSKLVAQYGSDEQRRLFCRLLYEAREQTRMSDDGHASLYLSLEYNFRLLCRPDFDKEASFASLSLDFNIPSTRMIPR